MLPRAVASLAALLLTLTSSSAFGFIRRASPLDAFDAVSERCGHRAQAVEADEPPPIRRCEVCLSRLALAYAGQQWDPDVGLSYAQQRWYDPGTGRFLSEDPVFGDLENPMSLHPFVYANGNPLSYTDPTGEAAGLLGILAPEHTSPYLRTQTCSPNDVDCLMGVGDEMRAEATNNFTRSLAVNAVASQEAFYGAALLGPKAAVTTTVAGNVSAVADLGLQIQPFQGRKQ